jgi:hypothetical protein
MFVHASRNFAGLGQKVKSAILITRLNFVGIANAFGNGSVDAAII